MHCWRGFSFVPGGVLLLGMLVKRIYSYDNLVLGRLIVICQVTICNMIVPCVFSFLP